MRYLVGAVSVFAVAAVAFGAEPSLEDRARAIFKPLPKQYDAKENPITPAKVELGKMLFFDKRLSKNHDVSCDSCHDLANFGVDGNPTSTGHRGQKGGRNSPTVYDAGNHIAQFWDGRAPTLEEQAKGPVLNPVEMAMPDKAAVEKVLRSIPDYAKAFKQAFPGDKDAVSFDNMALAIGAFERTLVTPSRFDAYLQGDAHALTQPEKDGLKAFMDAGCIMCHSGEGLGGGMYQKFGLAVPVLDLKDTGRFEVTKQESDRFVFRVPGLRNTAKTGPYLHDGSVATLEDVVSVMATHQLNKNLGKAEVASIVTFLKSLTGELPKKSIAAPKLPASGKDTPKPDPS